MADRNFSNLGANLTSQAGERGRSSMRISPPPMKRQHTAAGDGRLIPDKWRATALRAYSVTRLDETQRRHSDYGKSSRLSTERSMMPRRESEGLRLSSSSSNPPKSEGGHQDHSTNSSNLRIAYSNRQSKSGSSNKSICQVCKKGATVRYDPIIACPGCYGRYHDSCRKPALAEETDSKNWRCYRCLGGGSRRASVVSIAAQHPASIRLTPSTTPSFPMDFLTKSVKSAPPSVPPPTADQLHRGHDRSATRNRSALSDAYDNHSRASSETSSTVHVKADSQRLHRKTKLAPASLTQSSLADTVIHPGPSLDRLDSSTNLRKSLRPDHPLNYNQEPKEIPNTPTPRSSSPLSISSSLLKAQSHPNQDTLSHVESSVLTELSQPKTITSLTVLCSICQKQRVITKKGALQVICHSCQRRSLIAKSGKLEVPETPEDTYTIRTKQHEHNSSQPSGDTLATSHSSSDHKPLPWFQSDLVAKTPKIMQRKVGASDHNEVAEHNASPQIDYVMTSLQDANDLSQVYLPKTKKADDSAVIAKAMQVDSIANETRPHVSTEQSSAASQLEIENNDALPHSASNGIIHEVQDHISISSSSDSDDNTGFIPKASLESIIDTQRKHLSDHTSDSTNSITTRGLSSDSRESTISVAKPRNERRYTMRQLARIALVAANGVPLTSSQIIVWIADTFSHLHIGEGKWEMSLRSVLSAFDEFRGHKIPGSRGRGGAKLYDFSSANVKAQYETEYPEFCTGPNSLIPPSSLAQSGTVRLSTWSSISALDRGGDVSQVREKVKSAPPLPLISRDQPKPNLVFTSLRPNTQPQLSESKDMSSPQYDNKEKISMPFERPKSHQASRNPKFKPSIEEKAPFLGNSPKTTQPSIDTMTEAEKAQKIAEIKARPPRKRYFGSDYRLWHKRRHDLQDIHDERDGAWKRPSVANNMEKDRNMHENGDDQRTLKEVFDLPEHVVPMNDGQTELAFRDGTLINGKLPRPRNVYRVGTMFGGKLTTRTT